MFALFYRTFEEPMLRSVSSIIIITCVRAGRLETSMNRMPCETTHDDYDDKAPGTWIATTPSHHYWVGRVEGLTFDWDVLERLEGR